MINQSKVKDPRFWKKWRDSGAVKLVRQEDIYDHNRLRFNPPNAKSLKKEILDRVGDKHTFKVGRPKNIPIGKSYKRTEYSILMDNKKIGTLTRVIGPGFDNTIYEGRIPGYVNELIKIGNEFKGDVKNHMSVDQVILQHTIETSYSLIDILDRGSRKDGHNLKFVN